MLRVCYARAADPRGGETEEIVVIAGHMGGGDGEGRGDWIRARGRGEGGEGRIRKRGCGGGWGLVAEGGEVCV